MNKDRYVDPRPSAYAPSSPLKKRYPITDFMKLFLSEACYNNGPMQPSHPSLLVTFQMNIQEIGLLFSGARPTITTTTTGAAGAADKHVHSGSAVMTNLLALDLLGLNEPFVI